MVYSDILIKVRQIVRSINIESKKIQKSYGVSIPQVLCLSYLQNAPDYQASQKEITKYLNLNSSTVTGIIKRLEKKGLLARLPKTGDKRVAKLALTSTGDTLLKNIPPLLHERLKGKLEKLNPQEITKIKASLDTLIKLLEIDDIEAAPLITFEDDISIADNKC